MKSNKILKTNSVSSKIRKVRSELKVLILVNMTDLMLILMEFPKNLFPFPEFIEPFSFFFFIILFYQFKYKKRNQITIYIFTQFDFLTMNAYF